MSSVSTVADFAKHFLRGSEAAQTFLAGASNSRGLAAVGHLDNAASVIASLDGTLSTVLSGATERTAGHLLTMGTFLDDATRGIAAAQAIARNGTDSVFNAVNGADQVLAAARTKAVELSTLA